MQRNTWKSGAFSAALRDTQMMGFSPSALYLAAVSPDSLRDSADQNPTKSVKTQNLMKSV